ncbi:endonuclease domain-containing protein [Streptomyces sp. WI03-4A]|uniref:endonuclease domain-containing protein n=1 Tax=Streptomyces sp. WI03-4A TaxID=3028706 RepID=UPI0039F5CA30
MKTCTKCGEEKALSEFHRDVSRAYGVKSACKECAARWFQGNGLPKIRRQSAKRFGITESVWLELKERPCDVCGAMPGEGGGRGRHHIDHCHETGAVRGVLCMGCNTGIGKLCDSPELLARAIHYLTRGADYRAVDREA